MAKQHGNGNKRATQAASTATNATEEGVDPASGASSDGPSGGRSGGVVDAPGKRHRKPIPTSVAATASNARTANTMASKSRAAKMKLTSPRRG